MPWKPLTKGRSSDAATVSTMQNVLYVSAAAARLAGLRGGQQVTLLIDEDERRIAFDIVVDGAHKVSPSRNSDAVKVMATSQRLRRSHGVPRGKFNLEQFGKDLWGFSW